jgi:hypothetical protein
MQETCTNCGLVLMHSNTTIASNTVINSNRTKEGSTNPSTTSTTTNEPCTPAQDFPTETLESDSTQDFGFTPCPNAQDMIPWECPMCYVWVIDSGTECMICGYEIYGEAEEDNDEEEEEEDEDNEEGEDEEEEKKDDDGDDENGEEKDDGLKEEMPKHCCSRLG